MARSTSPFNLLKGAKSPSLPLYSAHTVGIPSAKAHSPRMLTIRKLAILVAGIFTLILLLLRQSPTSPSLIRTRPYKRPLDETRGFSSSSGKTKSEIERILENANRPLKSADEFATLRDHLEYLFPYEGPSATKFPAYIWQTWKYTPAMAEFDERFRMTEASWTERHPEYVHEVCSAD